VEEAPPDEDADTGTTTTTTTTTTTNDDPQRISTLRVRPLLPRKDSAGVGGGGGGGGVVEEEEEDLLEKWGPVFSGEETRRALEYLDGWLAMEINMEKTIEILEKDGWW
jgi:hypothetical protein